MKRKRAFCGPVPRRMTVCGTGFSLLLLAGLAWGGHIVSRTGGRGSELLTEPLPAERTAGNAALFAGIGEFPNPEASLAPLRYAPADAIALAHLFTQELKLIPPQRAWLALSYAGDLPPAAQAQLDTLKASGVQLLAADKSFILGQITRICRMADNPDDAILISFSSHGYEEAGQPYLMPRDGLRGDVSETGISLNAMTAKLQGSRAGKKILIFDACRERPPGVAGETRGDDLMPTGLQRAFRESKGVAQLISCRAQQQSWEAPDLQLGVYTHFLIEALRGRAKSDDSGYIRLGSVLQYASSATEDWVRRNRGKEQTPWFVGDEQARDIPLAVSTETRKALDSLQKRREAALELLEAARRADRERISAVMVDEVGKAVQDWTGSRQGDLLDQLELLRNNTAASRVNFARYWAEAGGAAARQAEAKRQEEARQLADAQRRAQEAERQASEAARLQKEAEARARQAEEQAKRATAIPAFPGSGGTGSVSTGSGQSRTVDLGGGVSLELVWIAPGSFTMGSPDSESGRDVGEGPQHRVTISKGFWMGKTEVTQRQYQQLIGSNPSYFKNAGQDAPVEQVSLNEAKAFCGELQARLPADLRGMTARLPTEAEWEYACRAGTTTALYTGKELTSPTGRCRNLDEIAWYDETSGSTTKPVGQKQPNAWGLYDMNGNVWEWCEDGKRSYSSSAATDPEGSGWSRVLRGGSWNDFAGGCRSAARLGVYVPVYRDGNLGFRVVVR